MPPSATAPGSKKRRREQPVEIRFNLPDPWSRQMFIALCRRYGLRPYRYPRMRRQSLMVRAPETFLNAVLWPEFQQINAALSDYIAEVTDTVIREAVYKDTGDADDIIIEREHFRLDFPIATSLIVSVILSLILWLLNR